MIQQLERISTIAYSYKETVQHSYDMAKWVIDHNIPGVMVECGVAAGAQIFAMQTAVNEYPIEQARVIFGFDSFEGIPLAGMHDTEQPGIGAIKHDKFLPESERLVSSGVTVHSQENVAQNMKIFCDKYSITLVKGWFQDTIPQFALTSPKISLLRLDGDLYESTMVCLKHLFPLVSEQGVVIIDDYALEGCKRAVADYFKDFQYGLMPDMIPVIGGVVYFHKF